MFGWFTARSRYAKSSILAISAAVVVSACGDPTSLDYSRPTAGAVASNDYSAPEIAGRMESKDIKESSGLAASPCQPDVLWTHNDAGDDEYIFAISTTGKHLGVWNVQNAQNVDWEEIAAFKDSAGKCFLLIGDIGNNEVDRSELAIYRVAEPSVSPGDSASSAKEPSPTSPAEMMKFKYPDRPHNAETMIVHPRSGNIYVLTKSPDGPSQIYKISPSFGSEAAAVTEKVGEISLPSVPVGFLTGGSVSPDGRRVILCDYQKGFELILPDGASDFDDIWRQKPFVVDLGKRKQGEAVTYSPDGRTIFASSESRNAPLTRVQGR